MKENDLEVKYHPYLQSRALWNDLYGSIQIKLQNAHRLVCILTVAILILSLSLVIITFRNPIKPYLTVLKNNEVLTLHELESDTFQAFKPKLAIAMATDFLQASRTLSIDETVNQTRQAKAVSYTSDAASKILMEHFKSQQEIVNTTIAIQILTVLVKSPQTLVFRWQETARDKRSGDVVKQSNYTVEMTFTFIEKYQSELQQKMNPVGFYITHLAWAKDL